MSGLSSFGRIAGGLPKQPPEIPALFWTNMLPTAAVTLTLTILTTDSKPILLDWGDGNSEWLQRWVATSHNYAAGGPYNMRIYTPARVAILITPDADRFLYGNLDFARLINCTKFVFRRLKIHSISNIGAMEGLLQAVAYYNNIDTLSFADNEGLTAILANRNPLTECILPVNGVVSELDIWQTQLATLNITGLILLTTVTLYDNPNLTSITGVSALGQAAGTHSIKVYNCSLTAACIDDILIACEAGGQINGYLNYANQTGGGHLDANRSAAALAAKNTLISRGWTVVIA